VIGVDVGGGLTVQHREPPIGVAVCHPAFLGAHSPMGFEVRAPGEHLDDGG
jgi:hypothetical protein